MLVLLTGPRSLLSAASISRQNLRDSAQRRAFERHRDHNRLEFSLRGVRLATAKPARSLDASATSATRLGEPAGSMAARYASRVHFGAFFVLAGNLHHSVQIRRFHATNPHRRSCEVMRSFAPPARRKSQHQTGEDNARPEVQDRRIPLPQSAVSPIPSHRWRSALQSAAAPCPATPRQVVPLQRRRKSNPRRWRDRRKLPAPASNSRASAPSRPTRKKTSCRCASSAELATLALFASTASLDTTATGIPAGSANPFTALKPTRTPVKLPGPFTATIAQIAPRTRPCSSSSSPTAATSVAE